MARGRVRTRTPRFVGLFVLSLAAGCGRIGLELTAEDADGGDAGGTDVIDGDGGTTPLSDEGGTTTVSQEGGTDAASDHSAIDGAIADAEVRAGVCGEADAAGYQPIASCGVGYCRSTNAPSRCAGGVEIACQPGAPRSSSDATCDGIDDNCNGATDENYVVQQCGVGACRSSSVPSSCTAGVETLCKPSAPLSSDDATANGIDDDCDGQIDEDVCVPRTDSYTFRPAVYAFAPPAGCTRATVTLWGGAGATGSDDGGAWGAGVTGGAGGAGGFAQTVLTISASSMIQLYVGQGGRGCAAGTTSNASYKGGAGGASNGQAGSPGADGSVTGGAGGNGNGSGGKGGNGSFGGGGGAAGSKLYTSSGAGGDGGGATVLLLNGARTVVAGGGAGGGGAGSSVIASGVSGVSGGTGCSGAGASASAEGGAGGGGGICQGASTQTGSGRTPHDASGNLPGGAALGGATSASCGVGGDGYALVTYAP